MFICRTDEPVDVNFPPWTSSSSWRVQWQELPDRLDCKQVMVWGTAGGAGVGGVQTEKIRGQSSQQRMERRDQEQSCDSLLLILRFMAGRADDANVEKYHHTQSSRARSSKRRSVRIHIFLYLCFISVWNLHLRLSAGDIVCFWRR